MVLNILKVTAIVFIVFVLLMLVAAVIPRQWLAPGEDCPVVEFHVRTYGHHTAFIFPYEVIPAGVTEKLGLEGNFNFIEFAWGDHDYFMNPEFHLGQGIKALFTPTESVMFVAGYSAIPEYFYGEERVKRTAACEAEFKHLLEFIMKEFAEDEKGNFILKQEGQRPNSAYYLANSTYHAFYNSNNWVSRGLRKAKLNTPIWGGLAFGLMWHVEER